MHSNGTRALRLIAFGVCAALSVSSPAPGAEPDEAGSDAADASVRHTPSAGAEEITVVGSVGILESEGEAVSVTAFSDEDLMAQGTSDIRGLSIFTPNLEVKTAFAASNPTLFVRGVGLKDYFANASSAVAVWNDGQYMNSPTGQLFQLFDVEGVEVLRGPNGTAYGRNASAGVIRISSREPTDDFDANLEGAYGSYDLVELRGALNTPVLDDLLSTRVSFAVNKRDGTMRNRCARPGALTERGVCRNLDTIFEPPGSLEDKVNDVDNWALRALAKLTPTRDITLLGRVAWGRNRSLANQFQKVGTRLFGSDRPGGGRDADTYRDPELRPQDTSVLDGDPYAGDFNRTGDENVNLFDASLKARWDLGNWSIENVAGYASNRRDTQDNADANPYIQLEIDWFNKAWQFTDDLRFTYDSGDRYVFQAGAWYLKERLEVDNVFRFDPRFRRRQLLDQFSDAFAIWTQSSYSLSETVIFDAGLRYNWDRKHFRSNGTNQIQDLPETPLAFAGFPISDTSRWDALTGTIELKYLPTELVTFYLKYTRGFKAGQYNGSLPRVDRVGTDVVGSVQSVDPENVDAFETGVRSSWLDDRLHLSGALFYQRYKDQQVFQLENSDAGLPVPTLLNAGESVMMGAEAEARILPVEWLQVTSNFGYLDSEYLDFSDEIVTQDAQNNTVLVDVDYSGNPLLNAPRLSWSGNVQLTIPVPGGDIVPRFDWSYRSEVFFDPNEGRGRFGDFPRGTLSQDDLWLFNVRIGYRILDDQFEVAFFARNLTDEEYLVDGFDLSSGFDSLNFVIGEPRILGVSLSVSYW